jgi:hypothetical protein
MTTFEVVRFNEAMFALRFKQFSGKLSYALLRNQRLIEPIIKKYYEDIKSLAKAFKIEPIEDKYNFEGESHEEFQKLLNSENSITFHKVDVSLIEAENLSVNEIIGLEPMIQE